MAHPFLSTRNDSFQQQGWTLLNTAQSRWNGPKSWSEDAETPPNPCHSTGPLVFEILGHGGRWWDIKSILWMRSGYSWIKSVKSWKKNRMVLVEKMLKMTEIWFWIGILTTPELIWRNPVWSRHLLLTFLKQALVRSFGFQIIWSHQSINQWVRSMIWYDNIMGSLIIWSYHIWSNNINEWCSPTKLYQTQQSQWLCGRALLARWICSSSPSMNSVTWRGLVRLADPEAAVGFTQSHLPLGFLPPFLLGMFYCWLINHIVSHIVKINMNHMYVFIFFK